VFSTHLRKVGLAAFPGYLHVAFVLLAVGGVCGGADRAPEPDTRKVAVETDDGVPIFGDFFAPEPGVKGDKAPLVILLHMYRQDRGTWAPLVPALSERGYAVVAIDLRGHGESVGPENKKLPDRVIKRDGRVFRSMHRDVKAAYEWAARQDGIDPTRFALVGASVGCSVAIDYAARDRSVDVVVCLSPGTDYMGVPTVSHIGKYGDRPILMLASEDEKKAPETLAKLAPGAEVRLAPKAGHGTRMFDEIETLPATIAGFMDKHIGEPAKDPVVASIKSKSGVFHDVSSSTAGRITQKNKRWFSSAEEATARGLRPPKRRGGDKQN